MTVRVRFADMRSVTRSLTLATPISATRMLAEVAEELVRGLIVAQGSTGRLEHFERLGFMLITTVLVTVGMMYLIHRRVPEGASV